MRQDAKSVGCAATGMATAVAICADGRGVGVAAWAGDVWASEVAPPPAAHPERVAMVRLRNMEWWAGIARSGSVLIG